jgi:hypothetical protein
MLWGERMSAAPEKLSPGAGGRAAGAAAALAATAAVACGICCVLPFALPAAVLAIAGGALAWLGGLYGWITLVAVLAVGAAWVWVGVQSWRTRKRPAASTLRVLGLATAMLALALAWPRLEPLVGVLLRR